MSEGIILQPFGSKESTVISEEVVALSGTTIRPLRYIPKKILAVYKYNSSGQKVFYSPETDYEMTSTGIRRRAGSSIYDFASYAIVMTGGTYVQSSADPRNPPLTLFDVVYVDYETNYRTPTLITGLASSPVGGLMVTAGDSITGAAHTSGREAFGNDGKGYVGILRNQLINKLDIYNWSIDGSSISELTAARASLLAKTPSNIIIAFGQNDHVGGPANIASFKTALTDEVTYWQTNNVRVILVGFMPKNPLWVNYSLADCISYNDAIAEVAVAKSVGFADVFALWQIYKANYKNQIELTGDNHHHPGNYGMRIYASKILPYLMNTNLYSNQVPWFLEP